MTNREKIIDFLNWLEWNKNIELAEFANEYMHEGEVEARYDPETAMDDFYEEYLEDRAFNK